jgi:epoxyqueuosine reductase
MEEAGIPLWGIASAEGLVKRGGVAKAKDADGLIVCLFPYYTGEYPGRNLARFAMLPDYHRVAVSMLEQAARGIARRLGGGAFGCYADDSPIREVVAAERAGLGRRGLNRLLIHERYGSYVFIGEIVTDLPPESFAPPVPAAPEGHPRRCTGCGRCVSLCPGGAIGRDRILRARCCSAVSQKKGELSPEEQTLLRAGGLAWGCDRCQEECPANRNPETTPIAAFLRDVQPTVREDNLLALWESRPFGYREPEVLRRNLRALSGPARL